MAISILPAPVKDYVVSTGNKEEKTHGVWNAPYIVPAGRIGLCVGFMSWNKYLKISVTADKSICKDTKFLVD